MSNSNMMTYESVKLSGKGKYIDIYRTLYYNMMVGKSFVRSLKNNV